MSRLYNIARRAKRVPVRVANHVSRKITLTFSNRTEGSALLQRAAAIPKSNGSKFYQKLPVRVGIVADPFVLQNYESTCQLLPIKPGSCLAQEETLDCLLVISAWRGKDGEWTGLGNMQSPLRPQLLDIMRQAKALRYPVLFYSKEDPPNYEIFLDFAKEADYIFTSAGECIPRYQKDCPTAKVNLLTFAVNPLLHNPIGSEGPKVENAVFFAGSWMKKYPDRIKKMSMMFRAIRCAGMRLYIADRNFSRGEIRYQYPIRYLRHVVGDFNYRQIAQLYKIFPWCMNINSVTDSDTMFAMRVYDALACGTQVLSNESVGIRRLFPEVHIVSNAAALQAIVARSRKELEEAKASGIRNVLRQGTVFEKMGFMLHSSGIYNAPMPRRRVGVMLQAGIDAVWEERLLEMLEKQSYPWKLLVRTEEQAAGCDMLCLWGAGREYGEHYLEDMVNGFKYTACDYITKRFDLNKESQRHAYTDQITDLYATVFWACAVTPSKLLSLPAEGLRMPNGYVSDCENYTVYESNGETT